MSTRPATNSAGLAQGLSVRVSINWVLTAQIHSPPPALVKPNPMRSFTQTLGIRIFTTRHLWTNALLDFKQPHSSALGSSRFCSQLPVLWKTRRSEIEAPSPHLTQPLQFPSKTPAASGACPFSQPISIFLLNKPLHTINPWGKTYTQDLSECLRFLLWGGKKTTHQKYVWFRFGGKCAG